MSYKQNLKAASGGLPGRRAASSGVTSSGAASSGAKIDAFDKAASYLGMQPRTVEEIRAYLKKKEYSVSEIDDAVSRLLEYGYLDDVSYAESYIRLAAARGKGRRRMEQELTAKGVSRGDLETAWAALEDEVSSDGDAAAVFDEKKRALEIAVKMTRQQLADGKPLDEKFMARVGRRLSGQGYSADTIYFAVNKLRGLKK